MSLIDQQNVNVTRTYNAAYVQSALYLDVPFRLIPNTTLNERYAIQSGVLPNGGKKPTLNVMTIGNKGHYTQVSTMDGSDEYGIRPFNSDFVNNYNSIPFALRPIENDFNSTQRQKYCLRRVETHFGKQYFAYYGRIIDTSTAVPELYEVTNVDGNLTVVPFIPTTDGLNPVPPVISNSGTVVGSNKVITSIAIISVRLDASDIQEIVEAHRIRTNSQRTPVISEIGLCSSVIQEVQGQSGRAGIFVYNEALVCQLNVHIGCNHPVGTSTRGFTLNFNVGGAEPLLGSNAVNVATFA